MVIAHAFTADPEDLKMPGDIKLDDGRGILIREWKPCARVDDVVSVTVEGILEFPREAKPAKRSRPGPPYYKWL